MCIENEYFIFYGVKSNDYKEFSSESNEKCIKYYKDDGFKNVFLTDNKKEYELFSLCDGMCGEYSCFGILYKRYGQDRWGEDRPIDEIFTTKKINKLKKLFNQKVGELNIDIGELEAGLHILYHTT